MVTINRKSLWPEAAIPVRDRKMVLFKEDPIMEWIQQLDRYRLLSDIPLTQREMMEFTGDEPDDPKCNIVFPR